MSPPHMLLSLLLLPLTWLLSGCSGCRALLTSEAEKPGWDAITSAMEQLYPGRESVHWGSALGPEFGGAPLHGVSAYDAAEHWHYVSYGMTELFDKTWEDPEYSGWGYEFTFRLPKTTATPPKWPVDLMHYMARMQHQRDEFYGHGNAAKLGRGIDGEGSQLTAVALYFDPTLPNRTTPHGDVFFLQLFGITDEETAFVQSEGTARLLELIEADNKLLITEPGRSTSYVSRE